MSKNPEAMIGKRVSVYWEEEDENMEGRIDDYNPDHGWHILYYSGDQEWVDTLDNVEFDDDGTYTNERRYSRTRAAESKLEFAKTGITEDLDEKLMQFYADTKHDFNFNDDNHDDNENDNDNYNNRNRSLRAESKDGTGTLELNIIPDSDEATSPVRIGIYNNNNNNNNNNDNNNNNNININNNNNNDDDDDDDENDNKIRQSTNSVNTTKTAASEYDVNKQPLNAVLLSGTIHSAKDLPNYDDDPFNESNIFFRVLYVEAGEKGNESTMFRCKTTIFKSENVPYGNNPRWNLDNFNFEMVLPENIVNGMKKPNVSALRGEILVAVYRNKGDSGNDFIGQTSFNLAKMIRYSKVINPKDTSDGNKIKIQIREEKGNFPLMNRNGEINNLGGSISAQFRIRWHGSPIMSKMEKAVTLKRNKSNKKSAAEAQAEAARKVQASSGYGKTLKTAKDLNRGAQWEAYRRIAQGRLDMHNEIFVNRLLRDAKGRQLTEAEKEVLKVYEKAAGEGKSKGSNNKAVKRPEWNERIEITALDEEMRRRESNKVSSGGGVGGAVGVGGGGGSACISSGKGGPSRPNQTRLTMDQLIQQKDILKSEVTKLTQESRDLKATKIRLERTLQRYETTVKRSKEAEKHGLKPKSITKNNNSMTSGNTGSISPFIDIDIDSIVDRELKDMVSEHYSLQAIRRNIVSRKSKAESEIKSIETSLEDMKARQLRAWQRLGNFQSEKDNEDGSHIDEDQSWLEQKAMDTFEKERAEVERLDIQQKESLHIGEVEDELEELYATKDALKTLILEAERSIDKFKYERDLWHERHSGMVGDNMVQLLNDGLKRMRWEHQRNKTSKMNISDIATGINKLDLSLLRFKLLQSQADYASESQRRVEERSAVRMDTLIENNDTTIGSNIDGIIDNGGAVSVEISPQTPSTQSKLSVVEKARKDSITMDDLIVSP